MLQCLLQLVSCLSSAQLMVGRDLTELFSLYHCECLECASHVSLHPTTNVSGHGRWFTRAEWGQHRHQMRGHALASRNLERIAEDYLRSTAHEQNSLSGMPPVPPAHPSGRKRRRSTSPPASRPSVRPRTNSYPRHNANDEAIYQELGQFMEELSSPESMLEGTYPYFLHPPHLHKGSPPQSNSPASNDLCQLDPNIPTNSVLIGYSERLNRARHFAQNNASHRSTKVRLRSGILLRTTERHQSSLRDVLFHEWMRQYRISKELNFVDTCECVNSVSSIQTDPLDSTVLPKRREAFAS